MDAGPTLPGEGKGGRIDRMRAVSEAASATGPTCRRTCNRRARYSSMCCCPRSCLTRVTAWTQKCKWAVRQGHIHIERVRMHGGVDTDGRGWCCLVPANARRCAPSATALCSATGPQVSEERGQRVLLRLPGHHHLHLCCGTHHVSSRRRVRLMLSAGMCG